MLEKSSIILIRHKNNQKKYIANFLFILLICLLPIVLLGISFTDLSFPLTKGDLLFNYQYQSVFWSQHHSISKHFGFPYGQDIRIWSPLDLFQTIIVGLFRLFTSNIFLAVNLAIYFSFIFSAFILWNLGTSLQFTNLWKKILVVTGITLPWFPGRIEHLDFLYIYIALIPLILILKIKKQRVHPVISVIFGTVCGMCGPYIFIFCLIVATIILVFEYLINSTSVKTLSPLLIFFPAAVLGFAISYLVFTFGQPETFPTLNRSIEESVHLAGYGFMLLMPLPWTQFPLLGNRLSDYFHIDSLTESTQYSNYGNVVILFASIVVVIISMLSTKRYASKANLFYTSSSRIENIRLLVFLVISLGLFFLKGGVGVFVSTVIPQIRAWNRLTPLIQLTVFIIFLLMLRNLRNHLSRKYLAFFTSLLLIWNVWTVSEGSFFEFDRNEVVSAEKFVLNMQKAIPGKCGIMQLPEISYPQAGARYKMEDYDHFLLSIIDKHFSWSYGSPKRAINSNPNDFDFVREILTNGYCGIVLDSFGYRDRKVIDYLDANYIFQSISDDKRYFFYKLE